MPEMMSYIFSTLEHSERFIRDQAKANRSIMLFTIGLTAVTILQAKRIKALEMKVKELAQEKED